MVVPNGFKVIAAYHRLDTDFELHIVVDRERYGLGWAHKEGLRRTQGDLIAFTDDCLPPPEWLASLVGGARPLCPGRRWKRARVRPVAPGSATAAARPRRSDTRSGRACRAAARPAGRPDTADDRSRLFSQNRGRQNPCWSTSGSLPTSSIAETFLRRAWSTNRGSTSFPGGGEDWELNARLAMLGMRFVYVPGAGQASADRRAAPLVSAPAVRVAGRASPTCTGLSGIADCGFGCNRAGSGTTIGHWFSKSWPSLSMAE